MVSSWSLCVGLNTVDPIYQLPLSKARITTARTCPHRGPAGFDAQHRWRLGRRRGRAFCPGSPRRRNR